MQDMVPRDKSIRNIPLTTRSSASPNLSDSETRRISSRRQNPRSSNRWMLWALGTLVFCAIAGILLSTLFENTTVTLYPKTATVTPTAPVILQSNQNGGAAAYQTLTITRSATTTVTASGSQQVSKSATGVVTIYNAYNTSEQKLIPNTRLATSDGKIYRIRDMIVVPGAIKKADNSLQPGSISTTIYADQPGATYNRTSATTFTIPGFKNQPQYSKFYGLSQGAISGGFVGIQAAVSPASMTTAEADLKQSLDSAIGVTVSTNIPDSFIAIPGTTEVSYTAISQTPTADSSITLSQNATGIVAIVRESDLATTIAKQFAQGYNNEAVQFANPNNVSLALATSSVPKPLTGPLAVQVSGPLTLVWQFDTQAIKQALVGKPKSSFQSIIKTFEPSVERAEAKVRPFWKSSFPTDIRKINITVLNP